MKMKLDPTNVECVFRDCLAESPDSVTALVLEGIRSRWALDRAKLAKHHREISDMLDQLPSEFKSLPRGGSGGWSFLNACLDRDGNQWTGMHSTMEQLFLLGIGTGQAHWLLPREMWAALPGEMPYVEVHPHD